MRFITGKQSGCPALELCQCAIIPFDTYNRISRCTVADIDEATKCGVDVIHEGTMSKGGAYKAAQCISVSDVPHTMLLAVERPDNIL